MEQRHLHRNVKPKINRRPFALIYFFPWCQYPLFLFFQDSHSCCHQRIWYLVFELLHYFLMFKEYFISNILGIFEYSQSRGGRTAMCSCGVVKSYWTLTSIRDGLPGYNVSLGKFVHSPAIMNKYKCVLFISSFFWVMSRVNKEIIAFSSARFFSY